MYVHVCVCAHVFPPGAAVSVWEEAQSVDQ